MGIAGPTLLRSKLFFRRLWNVRGGWDDPIEQAQEEEWRDITSIWEGQKLRIPRFALTPDWTDLQLHIFSDASDNSYGAAAYIRAQGQTGVQSRLVFAKNRLKPKNAPPTLTTPRMELLGILTGVRLAAFVQAQLQHPFSARHLWSDSRIALAWINSTSPQPQFIQNRLREIRSHADFAFHFVRTADNPADIGTRGAASAALMNNSLWWEGPEWLPSPAEVWPDEYTFQVMATEQESEEESEAAF